MVLHGGTVKFYCKDGLSSLTLMHIEQILNFGGKMKAVNCGAANQWVAINKPYDSMYKLRKKYSYGHEQMRMDIEKAMDQDKEKILAFHKTDIYKAWVDGKVPWEQWFQALAMVNCGHKITPPHKVFCSGVEFQKVFCPELIDH